MESIGKSIFVLGIILVVVGSVVYLAGRFGFSFSNLPLGHLPGDIHFQNQNVTCVFPLMTSIVISILLTIVLNLLIRIIKK